MKPPSDAPDAGLNMTPMIDIVFQLILFFLFNLRFKTLDWRIETQMPNVGPNPVPQMTPILPHVKATLVRVDAGDLRKARTKLKLAGREWILPDLQTTPDAEREAVFRTIEAELGRLRALGVPGEIDTPEPTGIYVPHGDVIRVLDAFLEAKFEDVHFGGALAPMPERRLP
jgi:biopolymer transport protein ExbD